MGKLNTTKFDKQDIILFTFTRILDSDYGSLVVCDIVLDLTSSKIEPAQTEVVCTSTWILHTYSLET